MMPERLADTIARIEAIQTTISGRAPAAAAATSSVSSAEFQTMLQTMLGGPGTSYGTHNPVGHGATGLTPVAGAIQSGPPPGFEGFENGQLPEAMLAPIAGSPERLWAPAAAALEHMAADAAREGISMSVTDGYRPLADQQRLARELGLYSEGGWAAVPGTSQHGWGRAVDLEMNDEAVAWMRANAWKYGFVETVPREPWHWEFHPAT